MFLDNLSANVLQLCDFYHLSYERSAERCAISSLYFGSIARGETAPTVYTLEKLCKGFDLTQTTCSSPPPCGRSLPTGSLCLSRRSAATVLLPT